MRWVIGDIHGMRVPLEAIVALVTSVDSSPRLFFVGDYVNRGPHSRGVIDFLLSLGELANCVRGNHDDVLDLILNDAWEGGEHQTFDPLSACGWFLQHGLEDTLDSYGLDIDTVYTLHYQRSPRLLAIIREAVPESHRKFFRGLPTIIEEPGMFVAHAFWPPEEANDREHIVARIDGDAELIHRVIWERWRVSQILADKPWTRPAFFGHTPVSNYPPSLRGDDNVPVVGPMVTLLDTAVALSPNGRLSAVCVEDGRLLQVDRSGRALAN